MLEHYLHPVQVWLILPLFAPVNAGVPLGSRLAVLLGKIYIVVAKTERMAVTCRQCQGDKQGNDSYCANGGIPYQPNFLYVN